MEKSQMIEYLLFISEDLKSLIIKNSTVSIGMYQSTNCENEEYKERG